MRGWPGMRLWPTRELTGRSIFGRSFATMGIATTRCAGGAARSVTVPALKAADALDARRAHAAFWAGGGASDSRLIITASAAMAGNLGESARTEGFLRQVRLDDTATAQALFAQYTELASCGRGNRVQERGTESWRRCGHSSCTNRSCAGSRAPCAASPPHQTSTTPCVPAPSRHAASPCLPFRARPSLAHAGAEPRAQRRAADTHPRPRLPPPQELFQTAGPKDISWRKVTSDHVSTFDVKGQRVLQARPSLHAQSAAAPPRRRPPSRRPRRWSRRRCAC